MISRDQNGGESSSNKCGESWRSLFNQGTISSMTDLLAWWTKSSPEKVVPA